MFGKVIRTSNKISFHTTHQVTPMIYAFTLPQVPHQQGWIKIGYTEKDVQKRIKQQTQTLGLTAHEEWRDKAIYDDGSGIFKDSDFHNYLRRKGVKQNKEKQGKEWFNISGPESQKMFSDFKARKSKDNNVITYSLRSEQLEAIFRTETYFNRHINSEFLWNVKPRFGKTLSVYDLCKRMMSNVLIVTNRPAVANSWHSDYSKFIGEESGFKFISEASSIKGYDGVYSWSEFERDRAKSPNLKCIVFLSLQDLKGSIYFGGNIKKLDHVKNQDWDLLVIDEAHEGTDTPKTNEAISKIKRKWTLHLSGTPFKAISNSKFPYEATYNWSYVDEQNAKRNWKEESKIENPYATFPSLTMLTYQMSEIVREKLERGININEEPEHYTFDLHEFFSVNKEGKFKHESAVDEFLNKLTHLEKFPFSTDDLRKELKHTLWLLNSINSVKALARKLKKHSIFGKYKIISVAGDGKINDDDISQKAFDKVTNAIRNNEYTITLSVGQLTVGVTVPEWTAVLMLHNSKSPSSYMQTAFRVQNPCMFIKHGQYFRKDAAYVFDFDPARTLDIYEEISNGLIPNTVPGDMNSRKSNVSRLLNFFAVIGEDDCGKMIELDAEKVLSIPRKIRSREVVHHGFMSDYLFQNIDHVFNAPPTIVSLINGLGSTKSKNSTNHTEFNDISSEKNSKIKTERVIGLNPDIFGKKIYVLDEKDITNFFKRIDETTISSSIEYKNFTNVLKVKIIEPTIRDAKEYYGSDFTISAQKRLSNKFNVNIENKFKNIISEYRTDQNTLNSKEKVVFDKIHNAINETKKDLQNKIISSVTNEKEEKKKMAKEKSIRDHLRGFSRTIPSFLMAYGGNDSEEITLANFDSIVPEKVFKEVTGITTSDFRILRDGGMVPNKETGKMEEFSGHLFDEVVFNDSVKEFLSLKKKLANYFDESTTENIFDYIPPQHTNQIFTPKKTVKHMVDLLEQKNPGCFDDETKTFIDLYMKSGLYLVEIAKRLYCSKHMKTLFPDNEKRLRHIFGNQIYGLAPTEIIYRIVLEFVLGFNSKLKIKHNICQCDALQYAKKKTLYEELNRIFKRHET